MGVVGIEKMLIALLRGRIVVIAVAVATGGQHAAAELFAAAIPVQWRQKVIFRVSPGGCCHWRACANSQVNVGSVYGAPDLLVNGDVMPQKNYLLHRKLAIGMYNLRGVSIVDKRTPQNAAPALTRLLVLQQEVPATPGVKALERDTPVLALRLFQILARQVSDRLDSSNEQIATMTDMMYTQPRSPEAGTRVLMAQVMAQGSE